MKTFSRTVGILVLYWMPLILIADTPVTSDVWGENTRHYQYERFFIASQPDEAALEEARNSGVSIVINLRSQSESDWDEAGAVASLGLAYHQIPVNGAAARLESEPLQEITALVEANPDARILVHCSSGNRAAAWLAVYLVENQGMNADESIETARSHGLTKQGLETKVRAFLEP